MREKIHLVMQNQFSIVKKEKSFSIVLRSEKGCYLSETEGNHII
ncbi:hypothetical protein NBRC111894_617 [Sporolactobacillus inulinus]|uniref:Uncharacterized protein n=1 Tax=Sporolactobacillus inulinus TaxID=2078 RepID=A0A4Y1Z7Q6_9BACL|nr:hypothetical protein NBRC111894_617 [Sporolactobacillus inulinus]